MSQKELLYLNDLNSHIEFIIAKLNNIEGNLDKEESNLINKLLDKNMEIQNSIINIMEDLC